jgi:hypothetical protein
MAPLAACHGALALFQPPPLLKRVAPPISLFRLVSDDMRQCRLHDLAREAGNVPRSISEAGAEIVDSGGFNLHAPYHHFHRHVG